MNSDPNFPIQEKYCIFCIVDGRILFSENYVSSDKFIEFDSNKTLMLRIKEAEEPNQFFIENLRLSSCLATSSKFQFPLTAIISMQNLTDPILLKTLRNNLSTPVNLSANLHLPDILN